MKDEFFVDTNILVYAFDSSETQKYETAKKLVKEITTGKNKAFISSQVLGELFTALTKKIGNPQEKQTAQIIVNGFIDSVHWEKINYNEKTVKKAMETSVNEKLPFWDSLIIETMKENNVFIILTENTKHFKAENIKAKNPFKT